MAALYRNGRSPFWWVKWRNPLSGKKERFSTKCRIGDGREHARAIQIRNVHALKESSTAAGVRDHPFSAWVDSYLETTHGNVPKTLTRYQGSWRLLLRYLDTKNISSPVQMTRQICLDYLTWRSKVPHQNGRKPVCRNTILVELKVLSKILQEAVARTYIPFNPCSRLGLKKDPYRPKHEMTDAQIAIIRAEVARRVSRARTKKEKLNANYLSVSFNIARLQGIRLSETHINLQTDVDFDQRTMFVHGKGGKLEPVNINPDLFPLLKGLRDGGKTWTFEEPAMPSLKWFKFFEALRARDPSFKNVSFHSTRVTVISRLERAGAPEAVVMKMVLHGSATVHRVYRKVKPSELAPFWPAVASEGKHGSS